jgi:hypothetical protein
MCIIQLDPTLSTEAVDEAVKLVNGWETALELRPSELVGPGSHTLAVDPHSQALTDFCLTDHAITHLVLAG